jgi:molybdopterin-binding protein
MARDVYTASDAARVLGISLDTLRRWDKAGRIKVERDRSNRRVVPASEVDRIRGEAGTAHLSARNRFRGIVTEVKTDGLLAQIELIVSDPVHLTAIITSDAVADLGLRAGMAATAIVKSTSVMVEN